MNWMWFSTNSSRRNFLKVWNENEIINLYYLTVNSISVERNLWIHNWRIFVLWSYVWDHYKLKFIFSNFVVIYIYIFFFEKSLAYFFREVFDLESFSFNFFEGFWLFIIIIKNHLNLVIFDLSPTKVLLLYYWSN